MIEAVRAGVDNRNTIGLGPPGDRWRGREGWSREIESQGGGNRVGGNSTRIPPSSQLTFRPQTWNSQFPLYNIDNFKEKQSSFSHIIL